MRARLRHPTPPNPSAAWCRLLARQAARRAATPTPAPGSWPAPPRPASRGSRPVRPRPAIPSPARRPAQAPAPGGAGCRYPRSLPPSDQHRGHIYHHPATIRPRDEPAPHQRPRERLGQPDPPCRPRCTLHLPSAFPLEEIQSRKHDYLVAGQALWCKSGVCHTLTHERRKLTVQPEPSQSVPHGLLSRPATPCFAWAVF